MTPVSTIPIVAIHRGYSWYLPYTLAQARRANPHAPIYLITDTPRVPLRLVSRCIPLKRYWTRAEAFTDIYRHLSPNSPDFERFCFQRWFVLREFLADRGFTSCFYLDSDVLVFSDLKAAGAPFAQADVTVNFSQGPYSTFINSTHFLNGFCDYIELLYKDPARLAALIAAYEQWQARGLHAAVSDMHALKEFCREFRVNVADTFQIVNDSIFDNALHEVADGFAMRDGLKDLTWRDQQPWGTHLASGRAVRLHTLHCQGGSKSHILTLHRCPRSVARLIGAYNRFFA